MCTVILKVVELYNQDSIMYNHDYYIFFVVRNWLLFGMTVFLVWVPGLSQFWVHSSCCSVWLIPAVLLKFGMVANGSSGSVGMHCMWMAYVWMCHQKKDMNWWSHILHLKFSSASGCSLRMWVECWLQWSNAMPHCMSHTYKGLSWTCST